MMSTGLIWADPKAFYLLVVVVLYVGLYFFFEKYSFQKLEKYFGKKVTAYLTQSVSLTKRRSAMTLQVLAMVFIVISLARPQTGEAQQEIKSEGVEIMVLADVSESMLAEDVRPSRLAQMKIELSRLLELMPGNKIGIIAFAGSSALLSPLTTDPNALKMYIDSLDTDSVSSQGTNFEVALSYAKEAFERGGVTQDMQSRTTRVILIVSDGEDQEKGAIEAAKALADQDIRIFSMAYGTEKGGAIPVRDSRGNMTGYKKDSNGQTILTQVHGSFLKSLAEAGKGQFYFAYVSGDHLRKLTADIDNLEKAQFQSSMMAQYDEKFGYPLTIGLVLLLLSFFISDRNTQPAVWRGRYEV